MKISSLFFCLVIFIGCAKPIYVPVSRTTTIIDTVTQVVGDSSLMVAYLECDSLNNVRIRELEQVKGYMAFQDVEFSQNRLKVETKWKTKFIDRIVERVDTVTVVDVVEKERIITKIPLLFWITFFTSIFGIIYFFLKFLRKIW